MAYLGAKPLTAEYYFDVYDGDGVTSTWPTTIAPATPVSVIVTVDGVIVDPQRYYFEGSNIYFFTAPAVGTRNIQLRYLGIPASGVAAPHTYRQVNEFIATEGQTVFNVRYYDLGYIDVYVNGVQLGDLDYQASDNSSVILQVGARVGDLVRVISAYNTVLTLSTVNATPNVVLLGDGLNSFQEVTPGTVGEVLMSTGDTWVSSPLNFADIFDQAAFNHANAAYNQANTATNNAASASIYANTGINNAASASIYANTGINNAASASIYANSSINNAASASAYANSSIALAQAAYNQGNSTAIYANTGINNAASASAYANAAYAAANAALLIPQNAINACTYHYPLVSSDTGKHIYFTNSSGATLYIPNNGQVNWDIGTTIMVISKTTGSANVTITPNTSVSLYMAANTTASSRVLVTYGMATLINTGANTWFINGTGVV